MMLHDNFLSRFGRQFGLYQKQIADLFNRPSYAIKRMLEGAQALPSYILRTTVEASLAEDRVDVGPSLAECHQEAHQLMSAAFLQKMQVRLERAKRLREAYTEQIERQAEYYASDVRMLSAVLFLESIKKNLPEPMPEHLDYLKRKQLNRTKTVRIQFYFRLLKQKHYLEAEIQAIEELLGFSPKFNPLDQQNGKGET